jgi:hypothetical protein
VNDLSALSKTGNVDRAGTLLVAGQKNDVAIAGGQILGDEWSDHVVKVGRTELAGQRERLICCDCFFLQNRSGIILRERYVFYSCLWFEVP